MEVNNMIYDYLLGNDKRIYTIKIIEQEIDSFKKINESYNILIENNIIINEDSIKSYLNLFITKIREIIRKLKYRIKELFTHYSSKLLDKISKRESNAIQELLKREM